MSDAQAANELFAKATADESGLTFNQILEKLANAGYWQIAGLSDASHSEQRKHVRSKLRSLHNNGVPVFSAFRGGSRTPSKSSEAKARESQLRPKERG